MKAKEAHVIASETNETAARVQATDLMTEINVAAKKGHFETEWQGILLPDVKSGLIAQGFMIEVFDSGMNETSTRISWRVVG